MSSLRVARSTSPKPAHGRPPWRSNLGQIFERFAAWTAGDGRIRSRAAAESDYSQRKLVAPFVAFIILRDGKSIAEVTGDQNRFGRQLFQNLQYSDTPIQPLAKMEFVNESGELGDDHDYSVVTVNTVGLKSQPTWAVSAEGSDQ
jgi:hypothetical protein